MNIYAKVIADSISYAGKRVTTLEISFPKVLLAEFNTHRQFSRSFSSSRAIPTKTLIKQDSFVPTYWGKNIAGMQASDEDLSPRKTRMAKIVWFTAIATSKFFSFLLSKLGLHKQWTNRLNDWHTMVKGVVTSTEWDNFFALRDHPAAQPEMQYLAREMRKAMDDSIPVKLKWNEWHLPYVDQSTIDLGKRMRNPWLALKCSAARCARVSYLKQDGTSAKPYEDVALHDRLVGSEPIHASPTEHQCKPMTDPTESSGNFKGWTQYRKLIEADFKATISKPLQPKK